MQARPGEQRPEARQAHDSVEETGKAAGLLMRAAAEERIDEVEVEETDEPPVESADDADEHQEPDHTIVVRHDEPPDGAMQASGYVRGARGGTRTPTDCSTGS